MANNENLVDLRTRTTEEQREIARMGGIASGKARAARKTFKEELLLLLANGDTQEKISLALLQKAMNGDTKAFEVLRDTVGEKPKAIKTHLRDCIVFAFSSPSDKYGP